MLLAQPFRDGDENNRACTSRRNGHELDKEADIGFHVLSIREVLLLVHEALPLLRTVVGHQTGCGGRPSLRRDFVSCLRHPDLSRSPRPLKVGARTLS